MQIEKNGMFALVGRPNAGKSTLLNALAGEKIAIVSDKPQTTRSRVMAAVNRDGGQYVFIDTPGFHKPRNRLGDYMVGLAEGSLADTDAVVLVVEPAPCGRPEELLLERVRAAELPCVLVINKIDTLPKEALLPVIADYQTKHNFAAVVPLSALRRDGVELLMRELAPFLQPGPALFPEDMRTDQPEAVAAAERIREKLLWRLSREVPHGVAVVIEDFRREDNGMLHIDAMIFVERDSHKSIVIGKDGAMLKEIGRLAREDLEGFFGCRVYLALWVKAKEGWRNNPWQLRHFGYEN